VALSGTYIARLNVASPTASATLPALQLTLSANRSYTIQRIEINQETVTATGVSAIELVTSTAVAPGTLATVGGVITFKNSRDTALTAPTLQTSGFAGGLTGTQVTKWRQGFNVLSGYLYSPTPQEQEVIDGTDTGFLWLRLPIAAAATYNISLVVSEQ
jgi:hypothetical protein